LFNFLVKNIIQHNVLDAISRVNFDSFCYINRFRSFILPLIQILDFSRENFLHSKLEIEGRRQERGPVWA